MNSSEYTVHFNGKHYLLQESQERESDIHALARDWFRTGEPLCVSGRSWRRESNLFFRNRPRNEQIQQFAKELFEEMELSLPSSFLQRLAEENRLNRAFFPIPCIARVATSILCRMQRAVDGMREFFADCFARLFSWKHPGPLLLKREVTTIPKQQYAPILVAHAWEETRRSGSFFQTAMHWITFGHETRLPLWIQHLYDNHMQFRFLQHGWENNSWGDPVSQWKRLCLHALKSHDGYVSLGEKTYNLRHQGDYVGFLRDFVCETIDQKYSSEHLYYSLPNYSEAVPAHFRRGPLLITDSQVQVGDGVHGPDGAVQLSITTNRERSFLQALPDRMISFLGGTGFGERGRIKLLVSEDALSNTKAITSFCHLVLQQYAGLAQVEGHEKICDIGTQKGYATFTKWLRGLNRDWNPPRFPSFESAVPLRFRR